MILDPWGFSSVVEWTDNVNPILSVFGTIPFLDHAENWKEWASSISLLPGISQQSSPNPFEYNDWFEWAIDFNQSVSLPIS